VLDVAPADQARSENGQLNRAAHDNLTDLNGIISLTGMMVSPQLALKVRA
jgi:hypothetical protein